MQQLLSKGLFFVLPILLAFQTPAVEEILINEFKEAVIGKDVQLIDIRTHKEYTNGFIDDAINIPIANKEAFLKSFAKLDKEEPLYIYCYSGVRSHRAGRILSELGFKKIYDFKGGWKAWTSKESPKN